MTIEQRVTDIEESLRLLRDANHLQRRVVSAAAPADNELLGWNDTTKKWEPKSDAPSARVYNSANLSIANGTDVTLTFNSERFDTDTIHNTSSNTSRLTATTAGKYLISATIRWGTTGTGGKEIWILLNGTTQIARVTEDPNTTGAINQVITTLYDLAATDYVELIAAHGHSSAINITATSNRSPEFMMIRLGPRGSASGATGDDHGTLTGLGDDDHTQYLLQAGTRALTGNWAVGDKSITGIDTLAFTDVNGTIAGIANKNLLDKAAAETLTGAYTFNGSVVINEGGADDVSFRVEGDTQTDVIYTDPVTNRTGFHTTSPQYQVHIVGFETTPMYVQSSGTNAIKFASLGTGTSGRVAFQFFRAGDVGWDLSTNINLSSLDDFQIRQLPAGNKRWQILKGGASLIPGSLVVGADDTITSGFKLDVRGDAIVDSREVNRYAYST